MEEADQLCERVAIMDHGKILALDTPAALKRSVGAETIVTVRAGGDGDALAQRLAERDRGASRARACSMAPWSCTSRAPSASCRAWSNAAESGGFEVADLSVAEPSLETVFINLTGKALRD